MRCDIDKFEVEVRPQPLQERIPTEASFLVLIHAKFKSDDPMNWGELRAYAAHWTKKVNRSYTQAFKEDENWIGYRLESDPRDAGASRRDRLERMRQEALAGIPKLDPSLKNNPRNFSDHTLGEHGADPIWDGKAPNRNDGKAWHLHNDQHIEIFYAKQVSGVPRSMPKSKHQLADDRNRPDNKAKAERPHEIDLENWHIVGRDDPKHSDFQIGDYVDYCHRRSFRFECPER
jgi:hypothetical protein